MTEWKVLKLGCWGLPDNKERKVLKLGCWGLPYDRVEGVKVGVLELPRLKEC